MSTATRTNSQQTRLSAYTLPALLGYGVFNFYKANPAQNCHRIYQLAYQPGLWSLHCIRLTWGRLGSQKLRSLEAEFEDEATAIIYLERRIARRLRGGYSLVA